MPKKDSDPFPTSGFSSTARWSWDRYRDVVPEAQLPELYAAILALDRSVRTGLSRDDDEKPALQQQRAHNTWLAAKADLRLEERLAGRESRTELERLQAL